MAKREMQFFTFFNEDKEIRCKVIFSLAKEDRKRENLWKIT